MVETADIVMKTAEVIVEMTDIMMKTTDILIETDMETFFYLVCSTYRRIKKLLSAVKWYIVLAGKTPSCHLMYAQEMEDAMTPCYHYAQSVEEQTLVL